MHPTGMHSCLFCFGFFAYFYRDSTDVNLSGNGLSVGLSSQSISSLSLHHLGHVDLTSKSKSQSRFSRHFCLCVRKLLTSSQIKPGFCTNSL